MRVGAFAIVIASVVSGAACNEAPLIRSVAVPDVASVEDGPYDVRVVAASDDGFGAARILVIDDDDVALDLDEPNADDSNGARFRGGLPGRPLGSEIHFGVEVCDPFGLCALEPATFPDAFLTLAIGADGGPLELDALQPDRGPASGGSVVTLSGSGFGADATVFFDDIEAAHVERLSSSSLRVITPAHAAGFANVSVSSRDATVTITDGYLFLPSPEIADVTPPSGPVSGGTSITIGGQGFAPTDRLFVDDVPCRQPRFFSDLLWACTTPPGRAGPVDIRVVDDIGGSAILEGAFRYVAAPVINVVSPSTGNSDGGTTVTIVGENFADAGLGAGVVGVEIGGVTCADVVVVSDTVVTCVTGAAATGAADVVVVAEDDQQGVLPGGFGFLGPPLVFQIEPDVGPYAGGIVVRLLGAGLAVDDVVTFGGDDEGDGAAVAEVIEAIDDLELSVIVPQAPLPLVPAPDGGFAAVDVRVIRRRADDERQTVVTAGFRYLWPPEIEAVVPGAGPTAGGTRVVVTGRFFRPGMTVTFDGAPCTDVALVSSSELLCTTPPGDAGPADVVGDAGEVAGPGAAAVGAYVYVPPPTVTSITPDEGPTFGGERVVVRGTDFQVGMVILIDGAACGSVVVVSVTEASCTTPPGDRGPATVSAENPDGQRDDVPGLYTYVGVAVTPDHGLPVGFTRVRVRAAGLATGVVVTFDGVAADCTRLSSTEADCQTPRRPSQLPGPVEVRFRNPDGTSDGDEAAFTYTSFAPSTGLASAGRNANHVVIADVDGDGDLDILVANGRVGTPELSEFYENDGNLLFTRRDIPNTLVTGNRIDVGRINSDAFPDLVIAASNSTGAVLLASNGPGLWSVIDLPLTAENSAFDAQLEDVVGDDRDDLVVLGIGCDPVLDQQQSPGCDPSRQGADVIFEQTGQGGGSRLTPRRDLIPHEARQVHDHKMVIFDADGDGDNDILVVVNNDPYTSAENRLLRNRVNEGRGFVKEAAAFTSIVGDLYDVDAGDIDGDGDQDVLTSICLGDGEVSSEVVLRNDGGNLRVDTDALPVFNENCTVGTQLIDVDSDGDLDALWTGTINARNNLQLLTRLYINRGDGTFVDASQHWPAPSRVLQGNNIAGADVDGDGDIDLVIAGGAPYAATDLAGGVILFEQR
jgi:hypothetical protein